MAIVACTLDLNKYSSVYNDNDNDIILQGEDMSIAWWLANTDIFD